MQSALPGRTRLAMTIVPLRLTLAAMPARFAPFRLIPCLVAPLLLLVISVHALTPLGQPLQRGAGSAFSAETADVSLRPGQRAALVKQAELPRPPGTLPRAAVSRPPLTMAAPAVRTPMPAIGARGPPCVAAGITLSPLSPRAPPAA